MIDKNNNLSTHDLGKIAELKAVEWFIRNGYEIYMPVQHYLSHDLLVKKNGNYYKVQVKGRSILKRNNSKFIDVRLNTISKNRVGNPRKPYKEGDFDILFIYVYDLDRAALLYWEQIKNLSTVVLRINSQKAVWKFEDFEVNL